MTYIRDMLYVNAVEKFLGRRLDEEELNGEPFMVQLRNGGLISFQVPLLRFPWDVITRPEELIVRDYGDSTVRRLLDNVNTPDGTYEEV